MKITRLPAIVTFLALAMSLPLAAAGDFQASGGGPPPLEGLAEALSSMLQSEGVVATGPDGKVAAEFWMRSSAFEGEATGGFGVRFDTIPEGALLGVVRFPDTGSDFREQHIKPGVYTMRFGLHPENGDHMGVAASRDFAVLITVEADKEPAKNYDFEPLTQMSMDSSGNPHPTIMRLELPDGDESAHIWQDDMEHWVLDLKAAEDVVGVVVYGYSEE